MKRGIYFLSLFVIISCSDPKPKPEERVNGFTPEMKTPEDSVMHEVMEAHDAAMAKMAKLNFYKAKIDSLLKQKPAPRLADSLKIYNTMLDSADSKMEKWMSEFNLDSAQDAGPARMPYLIKERAKITAARDIMVRNVNEVDSAMKK